MTKGIKRALAGLLIVPMLVLGVSFISTESAFAVDSQITQGANQGQGDGVPTTLFGDNSIFKTVVNVLLYVIGAISVVMLIVGGIRYTVSGGDSGQVTAAKSTIMYALIGLVVAFLAYAIVNWVLGSLGASTN